jgi:hypothetical protein
VLGFLFQVKVKVTLRLTVSQSVSLGASQVFIPLDCIACLHLQSDNAEDRIPQPVYYKTNPGITQLFKFIMQFEIFNSSSQLVVRDIRETL